MLDPITSCLIATISPIYMLAPVLLADTLGLDDDEIPQTVYILRPHAVLLSTVGAALVLDNVLQAMALQRSWLCVVLGVHGCEVVSKVLLEKPHPVPLLSNTQVVTM
jgi:hypothetical protein